MYSYIRGIVTIIEPSYVVIDNNGIGYKVFVPNPFYYRENEEYKIYIYSHIREDEYSLYGFKDTEERDLFLKLIDVKGLGPKMALPMLATGSISGIVDAINRENLLYLKKFPKIGDKVAKQIILDLKGKVHTDKEEIVENSNDDVVLALTALGYKSSDIQKILPKLTSDSVENMIKEALKLLLK